MTDDPDAIKDDSWRLLAKIRLLPAEARGVIEKFIDLMSDDGPTDDDGNDVDA